MDEQTSARRAGVTGDGVAGDGTVDEGAEDGAPGQLPDLVDEQAYVSMLYGRLDQLRARTRAQLERAQGGDGGRTHQALVDRDALVGMHARRLVELSGVEHGLCLGNLDHRDGSRLYVGRIGLAGDDHEPLLIDWRAPAAQPFYQATPAAPGEVVRRRHLLTQGRRVVGYTDDVLDLDALTVHQQRTLNGEAALLAALNAGRTGRMRDIVATIQAEQDRVIRSPLPGILVVQGGPGTGKTAVALHRAAYLLYTHRDRLARRGVLVTGPNQTFLRYIQQVLPSLGETGVLLATIEELYPDVAASGVEPAEAAALKGQARMVELLEAAVADRQEVPAAPVELTVDDAVLRLEPELCEQARAAARATGLPHNQARPVFVRQVLAALAAQRAGQLEADLHEAELLDEDLFAGADEDFYTGPLLDDEQLADLAGDLHASPAVRVALDRLWPQLTPEQLLTDLFASPTRLAAAGAAAGLTPAEQRLLLRTHEQRSDGSAAVADVTAAGWWTPADIPLLDEAVTLLGEDTSAAERAEAARAAAAERELAYARGVLQIVDVDGTVVDPEVIVDRYQERGPAAPVAEQARGDRRWVFGHVIVDEAQELSPMAWRLLARRCPSRSMTVVGDLAQTAARDGATSWAQALDPIAPGRWRLEELTVNYRTPAEIMTVAAGVLAEAAPGLAPPSSVRETGVAPWHLQLEEGELAARLPEVVTAEAAAVPDGRVAVLLPDSRAGRLGPLLAAAVPGTAATGGPAALDARVAVLPVSAAKGLEFDAVVVVDPDGIAAESPGGLRSLYVALTRATQRLGVVHTGPLPPVLAGLAGRAPRTV